MRDKTQSSRTVLTQAAGNFDENNKAETPSETMMLRVHTGLACVGNGNPIKLADNACLIT